MLVLCVFVYFFKGRQRTLPWHIRIIRSINSAPFRAFDRSAWGLNPMCKLLTLGLLLGGGICTFRFRDWPQLSKNKVPIYIAFQTDFINALYLMVSEISPMILELFIDLKNVEKGSLYFGIATYGSLSLSLWLLMFQSMRRSSSNIIAFMVFISGCACK